MTHTQFFWYIVVNGLVAVGTIGAVIAALFRDRPILFPPVFHFNILKAAGKPCPIKDPQGNHIADGRYYHLNVRNTRRWAQATHAQLRLIRIKLPGPDGQPQIEWDGDIPIRRQHQEFYPTESVIGSPVHYDLCVLINYENHRTPTLALEPIIQPFNLPNQWTGETHFVASFQLKCAERDSQIVRIKVDWDGTWHEGEAEMQQHLKLSSPDLS